MYWGMHRKAKRIYDSLEVAQLQRAEKNTQRRQLQDAWANFAEKHVRDASSKDLFGQAWFATLTTQYTLTLPGARRAMQRFKSIAYRKGNSLQGIWFGELFECKDGYHIHALIASDASRDELHEIWAMASRANRNHALQIANENDIAIKDAVFANDNEPHLREVMQSRSNFQLLKPGMKGGHYASKYTSKQGTTTDYDII
jgi:hypothetical protein